MSDPHRHKLIANLNEIDALADDIREALRAEDLTGISSDASRLVYCAKRAHDAAVSLQYHTAASPR